MALTRTGERGSATIPDATSGREASRRLPDDEFSRSGAGHRQPPGSLRGLALETDNLEHRYGARVERGVTFLGEPADQPAGRFAGFEDPDGNRMSPRQADGR
jgi:catechol 2,3-dioxygenase-like lactoylglutathione lyase family enzyme